ncbi:hypothetical protein EOD39_5693 [Acipenser ruthenus]|uniref:Uncharacterized protein n=1 Tax=Acipenser ruthenus TaxID=7906 RepID=A0A662Z0S3_ACIRT|nr:hypothetical protein EOD39_5693 [Acipenser ruthenus]
MCGLETPFSVVQINYNSQKTLRPEGKAVNGSAVTGTTDPEEAHRDKGTQQGI